MERSGIEVYKIIERGLSNDYNLRDKFNIEIFLDFQRNMQKWPWAFKQKRNTFNLRKK